MDTFSIPGSLVSFLCPKSLVLSSDLGPGSSLSNASDRSKVCFLNAVKSFFNSEYPDSGFSSNLTRIIRGFIADNIWRTAAF